MTDNKNEREHCERVANEFHRAGWTGLLRHAVRDLLLSERADAFSAGWKAGSTEYIERAAVDQQEAVEAADQAGYERGRSDSWETGLAGKYKKLQSRYRTLEAAACTGWVCALRLVKQGTTRSAKFERNSTPPSAPRRHQRWSPSHELPRSIRLVGSKSRWSTRRERRTPGSAERPDRGGQRSTRVLHRREVPGQTPRRPESSERGMR
jgi:hypothetical protein